MKPKQPFGQGQFCFSSPSGMCQTPQQSHGYACILRSRLVVSHTTNGVSETDGRIPHLHFAKRCPGFASTVCTLNLAGAQASGANIDVAGSTLHDCLYTHHIGLPVMIGSTVRVRNTNAKRNALAADFTFCHSWHLLYRLVNSIYSTRYPRKKQAFFSFS